MSMGFWIARPGLRGKKKKKKNDQQMQFDFVRFLFKKKFRRRKKFAFNKIQLE